MVPENWGEGVINERFFSRPLHHDVDTCHDGPPVPPGPSPFGTEIPAATFSTDSPGGSSFGRPPRTFFCHSSPSEYSFSHSERSVDCNRLNVDCPWVRSTTTTSSGANSLSKGADWVETITCLDTYVPTALAAC